ncbi:MAG: alpha-ketoacid dehydrogenase subunit beta [Calditrichaeota bacterium]|jgi:2-oxoisovalerate dehydrogenase E1 component beta subunit|nr:alpha-ketoacid dehydrogenase subunit beta [Calditrichota bacterium]MBT7617942.1 alpha-ketoacid dehydrogenase subunit beta [Calditrichota bacterium]MBT7787544.1 alpha-ketoacid dehydrogenase subunit beta [Calditrichota bacterium]
MPIMTYIQAISDGMREEMRRDPKVMVMGEDVGVYGGAFKVTKGFIDEFGADRVYDTPLSESAIMGCGLGMAITGLRPIVEFQFADFITSGFNQVVNNAGTMFFRTGNNVSAPVTIRCPSGAGVHGGPFHSQSPEAWFVHTPGLKVVAPSTPYDAKGLMISAIRDNNPVLYFEHKFLYRRVKEEVPEGLFTVPIGKAEVKMAGDDISVIAYGASVHLALDAAERLAEEGISVEVLDLRSLYPFDKEAIVETVKKTGRVLVAHEAWLTGGVGGEYASFIAEECFEMLDAPIKRLGSRDMPFPFAPQLEDKMVLNSETVYRALKDLAQY